MRFGNEYRREIWATDWIPRVRRRRSRVTYRSRVFSRADPRSRSRHTFRTAETKLHEIYLSTTPRDPKLFQLFRNAGYREPGGERSLSRNN